MYSKTYRAGYIVLPKTDDDLLVFFTSSVVLQLLALEMERAEDELSSTAWK